MSQRRKEFKQTLKFWFSVWVGWALVIVLLISGTSSIEVVKGSHAEQRALFGAIGVLLLIGGLGCIVPVTNKYRVHREYSIPSLLATMLGSALTLAGGFLLYVILGRLG